MAIKDAVITLKGADAKVLKVEMMKDKDGKYMVAAYGETKTSDGKAVGLNVGTATMDPTKALDDVWAVALPVLRKANDLE